MAELGELNEKGVKVKDGGDKVSFTVSDMPTLAFLRFKENARSRFGDCYWCYIKHLLEIESLYYGVARRLDELEQALSSRKDGIDIVKVAKTFGGVRNDEQVGKADKE